MRELNVPAEASHFPPLFRQHRATPESPQRTRLTPQKQKKSGSPHGGHPRAARVVDFERGPQKTRAA
ncbi:hypothetical protein CR51_31695 [Caballeronia megalochromosomata]|nr:hypothetical protein CR51_31695 [Caballeronia megalochromosomata]